MFLLRKKTKPADPPASKPTPTPILRPASKGCSPSVSSGSSGSSGERKVRFSDEQEVQQWATHQGTRSPAHRPTSGSRSPQAGRPPRSPPVPSAPGDRAMQPSSRDGHSAPQAGAAAAATTGVRSPDKESRRRRGEGSTHHADPGHKEHHSRHHRQHRTQEALPPPEEVAAAAGGSGEDRHPGSLAECARLFHKYKDPKRGKVGVEGFGRLLGDAGRLDGLRSPIVRAACVKREMTAADSNANGWVDWAEFSAWFSSFQQQHYTQERNHFYEEKGKEAEAREAEAAAAAAAAAKAEEEQAAAEAAARKARCIAARAAAKRAWEEARRAAKLKAKAAAAAAAAGHGGGDTPPHPDGADAVSPVSAAAAGAVLGSTQLSPGASFGLDLTSLSTQQLDEELKRLELNAANAAAELAAARARASGLVGAGSEGAESGSLPSSGTLSGAPGTPLPSPATGSATPAAAASRNGLVRGTAVGQLDTGKLRRQLQREALLLEAAAAAAAADSAAAAAAAAEKAAQQLEAEEAVAAADAAAVAAAAADPDLQRVFAAFAAFGKNSELRGTAAIAPLLDVQQFGKLCRDTRLVGGPLTLGRVDIIFTKVAGKGGSRMNWKQFAAAVPMLARTRGCAAEEAMQRVAACPGPQLNSELAGGTAGRQGSFTGRSGSFSGSRTPSVAAGSEEDVLVGAAGPGDDAASDGGGSVGGFTPVGRPSSGGGAPRRHTAA